MKFVEAIAAALAAKMPALMPVGLPQFAGQHYATPTRRARRELVRRLGRRQAIRAMRYQRATGG